MSLSGFLSLFDRLRRPLNVRGEGWVHHHPRDNFYQSTSFFPMSFAMITTVNEEGVTSIGPHSLTFPFDLIEHPSWMLISRAGSNTTENLRSGSKAALHFIEFKKSWLKPIVKLGYPGLEAEEKMQDIPFKMVKSPSAEFADDPKFPLIMDDALEVFECEIDGEFQYQPHRDTDPIGCEAFWCLKIKNILMKESFEKILQDQKVFPSLPISYGFRHNDSGARRFFFTSHNKPFPVPVPTPEGLEWQPIYYAANKIDEDVRFTEDSVKLLVDIPKPFIKMALNGIIKEAKEQGVEMVDDEFVAAFNAKRKGERENK